MITDEINWDSKTVLYILSINGMVKFGITSNWIRRENQYRRELKDVNFVKLKEITFPTRWQAELIEQVMKWRLRRWVVNGRHEWIQLPIQPVFDCMYETISELELEYQNLNYIHKKGKNRWDFYKQLSKTHFRE